MKRSLVRTSKFLSLVLRHRPETIGLELDEQGWAPVDELLEKMAGAGRQISDELLREVVETNDKKRFALSPDGTRIRASQGHSLKIDLALDPVVPPDVLFHGTATRHLESIQRAGLIKGRRQHVHLSADPKTARNVGERHGQPVVLTVDAATMHDEGLLFYRSANGVWLTEHVPPAYLAATSDAP